MQTNLKKKQMEARRLLQRAKAMHRKSIALDRAVQRMRDQAQEALDSVVLARQGVKLGQSIRFNGYDWTVDVTRRWKQRACPSLKRPSGGCAWGRRYDCTLEKQAKYLKLYLEKKSASPFKLITPEQARAARQAVVYKATLGEYTYRIRKSVESTTPIVYLERKRYGKFREISRHETVEQAQAALIALRMTVST